MNINKFLKEKFNLDVNFEKTFKELFGINFEKE